MPLDISNKKGPYKKHFTSSMMAKLCEILAYYIQRKIVTHAPYLQNISTRKLLDIVCIDFLWEDIART